MKAIFKNPVAVAMYLAVALQASPLWAQAATEEKKNRWVLSYFLVGLLLGLSLFSICRSAGRQKK